MPTERATPTALFIFAHQDDEFGVFQTIADCRKQGIRVACVYLTHGANGVAARRNAESLKVLAQLGVPASEVSFAGDLLGIADGTLPGQLGLASQWLAKWLDSFAQVELVCVTAWEGGHHDHDALHFATLRCAAQRGLLPCLRQFSLYNAWRRPAPWFRVLAPLPDNGPAQITPIGWRDRLRFLGYCLSYPSQRVTWLGLFPFVLLHYLLHGTQALQAVAPERVGQRPHAGPLYYENRRFFTWEAMQQVQRAWPADAGPFWIDQ
jgi:LmbE family N-acetylglucosaminyl deacetylase